MKRQRKVKKYLNLCAPIATWGDLVVVPLRQEEERIRRGRVRRNDLGPSGDGGAGTGVKIS